MTTTPLRRATPMLSKVPEVTVWFWIIKILCTTVGESFADYINETLGFGLVPTAVLFTVVFAVVLAAQMRLRAYVPGVYWLTVVVVSVTGTLYTDILTDQLGVPLWISSAVFAALLAGVFGAWYARERTLSIHSIVTTPRESWYWLAVLVTFALGTATGDWTLELTGWAPGQSVLLPLTLIALVTALWRFGANPVLSFWLAYILTRPLGANIGDWLATPAKDQGLGLGTFGTSLVFLGAILACVVYLSLSRADVVEEQAAPTAPPTSETRQRVSLGVLALAAVATCGVLGWANSQPHQDALAAEEGAAPSCSSGSTHGAPAQVFPAADVRSFAKISQDVLAGVRSGDRSATASRATDLETAWDDAQDRLVAKDCGTWTYVDHRIDDVLTAVRASSPDPKAETSALTTLIHDLG